jgi:hypothetical protein
MLRKAFIVAGSVLFAASAFAQTQQNQGAPNQAQQQPQAAGSKQPNAQGEKPAPGRTMQEKETGLMEQSTGAPGSTGSTGTQSGSTPNAPKK